MFNFLINILLRQSRSAYFILWRKHSYKKTPQATDTFKEAISPCIGSFAVWSAIFITEFEIPFPSDPMIIAQGSLKEVLYTEVLDFSVAAITFIPDAWR